MQAIVKRFCVFFSLERNPFENACFEMKAGAKASAPDASRRAPRTTFETDAAVSREAKVVSIDFRIPKES